MHRIGAITAERRITAIAVATGLLALALAILTGGGRNRAEAAAGSNLPQKGQPVTLDPAEFTTKIDNPYFPAKPGSKWVYRETDAEGTEQRVVVTVTNRTKRIANGVKARVVHDVVSEGGEPVEVTDDFYSQDAKGNVWYLGEDTTEFKNGKPASTEGSFEAGVDGAQPGVIMPAKPRPGLKYREEFFKGEAEDKARVISLNEQAEVPFGRFDNVLRTRNLNPLEPKIVELKFYARGIGPVEAITVAGGSDHEELIEFRRGK